MLSITSIVVPRAWYIDTTSTCRIAMGELNEKKNKKLESTLAPPPPPLPTKD
jgi:hypothetical protein